MPLKKTNDNQLSRDDIVRVLDLEEENLSADIRSKLRQNRYKAIDHAGIIDKRDYVREAIGWGVATAASAAVVVFLMNNQSVIDKKTSIVAGNLMMDDAGILGADSLKPESVDDEDRVSNKIERETESNKGNSTESNINDDNKQKDEAEDLEIYEWLYNNYG